MVYLQLCINCCPSNIFIIQRCIHLDFTSNSAFSTLKQVMIEAPVLNFPNFSLDFVVEIDASNVGIGVVLMQAEEAISSWSVFHYSH